LEHWFPVLLFLQHCSWGFYSHGIWCCSKEQSDIHISWKHSVLISRGWYVSRCSTSWLLKDELCGLKMRSDYSSTWCHIPEKQDQQLCPSPIHRKATTLSHLWNATLCRSACQFAWNLQIQLQKPYAKTASTDGLLSYVKTFIRFALFISGWNEMHVQFQNVWIWCILLSFSNNLH
jgi:hypothetical protein